MAPASMSASTGASNELHDLNISLDDRTQSVLTSAVRQRDIIYQITAHHTETEAAHLVPEHEKSWFLSNSMMEYNMDILLDPKNLMRDLSNVMLFRSDLHSAFDSRKFVLFPKMDTGFVLHMLEPTPDPGPLYHNIRTKELGCGLEFLFARFAWSIFLSLAGFLSKPNTSRLVVRLDKNTKERLSETVTDSIEAQKQATASRSSSPKKLARSNQDAVEEHHTTKPRRSSETASTPSHHSSKGYTVTRDFSRSQTLYHDEALSRSSMTLPIHTPPTHSTSINTPPKPSLSHLETLRERALTLQRLSSYIPGMPLYDLHRPAKEELEIMGVEILEALDEDS
ncbi:hypothetical protein DL98DRAFT_643840 [Cadophora sp. DSE1049]|nr:hypothetical protein DL98DRAFT_643840 [Cadophora sp. DSE1049]